MEFNNIYTHNSKVSLFLVKNKYGGAQQSTTLLQAPSGNGV